MDEELIPAAVGIHRDASRRTTEPGHLLGDQPIEVTEGVETQYGHRVPPSACLALIGAKASPLRACAPCRFFKAPAPSARWRQNRIIALPHALQEPETRQQRM